MLLALIVVDLKRVFAIAIPLLVGTLLLMIAIGDLEL